MVSGRSMNRSSAARLESGVEGLGGFSCSDNRYVQQSWANNAGEMSLGGKFVRASLACVRSLLSPKTPLQTMSIRSSGKTQEFATEAEDSLRCSCHGALREKKNLDGQRGFSGRGPTTISTTREQRTLRSKNCRTETQRRTAQHRDIDDG